MKGEIATIEQLVALRPAFLDAVRSARRVLIGSHHNPDGDAIGSSLAMYGFVRQLGIEVDVVNSDPVPDNLRFLPGAKLVRDAAPRKDYDLGIVLDLDAWDRLGRTRAVFDDIPRIMVIDHHVPHEQPGDLRIVMTGAPATCAMLADLMLGSGVPIDHEIATHLLVGILTDTGNFRFPNTTPHSLHLAAQLIEHGANLAQMAEEVYHRKALPAVRLLGWALTNFQTNENATLAWVAIPQSIFDEFGARDQDTEGIVNELLSISTARIAMILRETPNGRIKGSLRSRGPLNVAEVARQFGGGGHENAAGVSFTSPLPHAESQLVEALQTCLASS